MNIDLAHIVDLQRYPIHHLDSAEGAALVQQCRYELEATAVCQLDGFLRPDAVERVLAAADALVAQAWVSDQVHNVYFEPVPHHAEPGDPLAMVQHSSKHAIAYDLLPADLPLRVLYESPEMLAFAAAALGREVLYRSADPLDALEIAIFDPGQELGWHFDNSEYSITLMLQPALEGGAFDYLPAMRSHADPNHAGVAAFLAGTSATPPIGLHPQAGTLSLFQGHLAIHRVAPVAGTRSRINAVLTYGAEPDMQLSDLTRQLFYGRLA